MRRDQLTELHYITPIVNVASIRARGILSHRLASRVQHVSVADPDVQTRRARVRLPDGSHLHDYANLYLHGRNPMLYKRLAEHMAICVLRVSTAVLELPGTVVTDRNAAADWVRFSSGPEALSIVDGKLTFLEFWTHPDVYQAHEQRSRKCAEVLVRDRVPPEYIFGGYTSCAQASRDCVAQDDGIVWTIDRHFFFLQR